jgi:predicted pyridoxine 5'-phosphate oxidase superfamily flavin-nucleotide-binding protein
METNPTPAGPVITKEMQPALQGVLPCAIATCAADGTPNATFISQVFYVDDRHVALSFQFMNKTWRNLQENPVATVVITCPGTFAAWKLRLRFLEKQTEGPVFDQMDLLLHAMSSMLRVKAEFAFQAALLCRVESVKALYPGIQ